MEKSWQRILLYTNGTRTMLTTPLISSEYYYLSHAYLKAKEIHVFLRVPSSSSYNDSSLHSHLKWRSPFYSNWLRGLFLEGGDLSDMGVREFTRLDFMAELLASKRLRVA